MYVWGTGILGQLGIGRRGTSKGRLFPTPLASLQDSHRTCVIDVACGDNFSVAVTSSGEVYSWGHSEYNQHGQGSSCNVTQTCHDLTQNCHNPKLYPGKKLTRNCHNLTRNCNSRTIPTRIITSSRDSWRI